jgi:hypothetical protein
VTRLRADDALRDRYEALKRRLAKEFRDDREAYTNAKADFIDNTVACRRLVPQARLVTANARLDQQTPPLRHSDPRSAADSSGYSVPRWRLPSTRSVTSSMGHSTRASGLTSPDPTPVLVIFVRRFARACGGRIAIARWAHWPPRRTCGFSPMALVPHAGACGPDSNWFDASRPEEYGGIEYGGLPENYSVFIW